ncbi:MAG: hypothetical protein GX638_02920, partial [Crenarchaeota archaeon]|nr:hypothetical protein [Thermoproteota archaeon]
MQLCIDLRNVLYGFFGSERSYLSTSWLESYQGQCGDKFLGIYFGDEIGGKMLDNETIFYNSKTASTFTKLADDGISNYNIERQNNYQAIVDYHSNGNIILTIKEG